MRVTPNDRPPLSGKGPKREAPKPRRTPEPKAGWRRAAGRLALRLTMIGFVWGAIGLGLLVAWAASTLPDTSELAQPDHHPSITLRASDDSLIATFGDLYGEELKLTDLPKALPEAVIATEDRRFYHHFGIDPLGVARAIFVDLKAGQMVQGGSTITQQVAKNLFLTPDKTLLRKVQEAVLAVWLERHFTKDQLLEIYLNRVYFGAGTWGVDAASRRYFGKSARRLSPYECALLAGLLKAPTRFSPARDQVRAATRTAQVLTNMVAAGYLSAAEATTIQKQSFVLSSVPITRPGMRYFADWVQDQAATFGLSGDITVVTTLDPKMQLAAEGALDAILTKDGAKAAAGQASLIAMSPDGAIRAMVGGRDYQVSQFNRTVQSVRQPGSAFKPFVYLTALEHGMRPDDHFTDGPTRIGNWQPHDFENRYLGDVTMAEAVAESLNTVAAQVAQKVGIRNVIATAHRLGITSDLNEDPSLALGTGEVSLIELTSAYSTLANGGYAVWPYGIAAIRDANGKVFYQRQQNSTGRIIQAQYVADMDRMLQGVIQHGTGKAAAIGRPAAGKTGTTSDFRDALFVGYTADLVTGVWFGNDDDSPMAKVTGGSLPARAWHDFMTAALKGTPARPLTTGVDDEGVPMAANEEPDHQGFMRILEEATKVTPVSAPSNQQERPGWMPPVNSGGR
ncbi:MAG TPA: PBP1A family penicillin-binding protein [Aliidongia sp.]|uniref:transglycosylase domain-containing protein n=1 Tax=Aliidongia sp. TaxID=1914230 RepID=UPI002DDDA237|nr:PBP1A family penicillin-binding protein [Aliidongia sp.]HEV2673522.1 PBP1A family penicillin-binding protein [Aliidongia sp.]